MDEIKAEHSLIGQLLNQLDTQSADNLYDRENMREFKKLIDEIPGGFLIYHADGEEEIIYANRALLRIFGCDTLSEFRSHTHNSFRGVVHAEDLDEIERSIAEQIANSQDDLDYVEYRIVRKDGVIRWVEDYGHLVRTELGNIFYVFIGDATEKVERRLHEKNELMSTIEEYDKERTLIRQEHLRRLEVIEGLSVNYVSILYADLDSDKILPYRYSRRIECQFESKQDVRPYSQIIDGYAKQWVHPDDKALFLRHTSVDYIRSHLKNKETFYFNYRYIENGETKYLQMRIVDVGSSGRISQVVMGIRAIDDEILQEVKQKQILQDALNTARVAEVAKNAFLSNMSHDMRTPLNAILGYLALAKNSLDSRDRLIEYLGKIETAGRQILDLVEKVLEFSYTESQDAKVSDDECNLADLVKEIYEALQPSFEQKDITFVLDTKKVNHLHVYADREKLKKILRHLIGNAVKYTDKGNVSVTLLENKAINGFAMYRFEIKDTGIGINPDVLDKIFAPFERENNTTMSGIYGAGLGLTICKQLVEMLGGTIEVVSKPKKGSTFSVNLSLRILDEETAKTGDRDEAYDRLQGRRILLAEDNEINREIETEILQNFGFVVDTAENGKIAVEKMRASRPGEYDVVLMDIQMPVMDGREATQAIRALGEERFKNIPIIALSANAFESDKRASMESGMNEHLPKPLDVDLLLKTIAELLKDKKYEI